MTVNKVPIILFFTATSLLLIVREVLVQPFYRPQPKQFISIEPEDSEEPVVIPEEKSFLEKLGFWKDLCD